MSTTDPITGAPMPPEPKEAKNEKPQKEFPKVEKVRETDDRTKKRKQKGEETPEKPKKPEDNSSAIASSDSILNPVKPGAAAFKTTYSIGPTDSKKPLNRSAPPPQTSAPEEPAPLGQAAPPVPLAAPMPPEQNVSDFIELEEMDEDQEVAASSQNTASTDQTQKKQPVPIPTPLPKTAPKEKVSAKKPASLEKPESKKAKTPEMEKSKVSGKKQEEKKNKEDEPSSFGKTPENFTPLTAEQLKAPPPPAPPASAAGRLSQEVSELFEKMVGHISAIPSKASGEPTTTTVSLTAASYQSSAFYGVKIVMEEFRTSPTAPVQYKITLQGKPEQVKLLQKNVGKLMNAFTENFTNAQKAGLKVFQVKSIVVEPIKGDNKETVFKRKGAASRDNKKKGK